MEEYSHDLVVHGMFAQYRQGLNPTWYIYNTLWSEFQEFAFLKYEVVCGSDSMEVRDIYNIAFAMRIYT